MTTTIPAREGLRASDVLAEQVVQLRYWQHLLNEDLKNKVFGIPVHLAFGHEAIAVAIGSTMTADDQLVLTHRNVAYNLVRAGDLTPVRDEFLGRPTGLAGGRLGSMNLVNRARGIVYSSSILGNNFAVGCGLALAKSVVGAGGIVTVMTGDGAMEEGPFYESLVFARTHGLRLIVAIENNDQSMSSTIAERRVPIRLEQFCAALDVPFTALSGNDVFEYADRLALLHEEIQRAPGPHCIEVELTAHYQHAGPTPGWPTDPKRIDLANGLIVVDNDTDPLHVLRERIGGEHFEALDALVRGASDR